MNIDRFKKRLLDKERELLTEIARLKQEARAATEAEVRDFGDRASSSQGAAEALQEETLVSQTLRQVQDALRRIEDGTYGTCADCGRPIEPARLEAVPWTSYCLEDQQKHDTGSTL